MFSKGKRKINKSLAFGISNTRRKKQMSMNKLEPENFELERSSVWRFPIRGDWATHDGSYRGNWSPYIPRNIILRYTKEGDLLIDQFVGGGTTLIEAKLLNRNAIGIDINPDAIERTKRKLQFDCQSKSKVKVVNGDATNLSFIRDNSIDLICTHPPYADIIKYSSNTSGDISLLSIDAFLLKMNNVAEESFRVLKENKFCAFLMGDIRKNGFVYPLGFQCMSKFLNVGFKLKEIVVKEQFNCLCTNKWLNKSLSNNFLLLAHEYLFILKK